MSRPGLLFHCQHSVGLGHLARSLAIAGALAGTFRVVLLNGGRMPAGVRVPDGVEVVNLPPLGHDDDYALVSHDPAMDVDEALRVRGLMIRDALEEVDPRVVLVELWPFGRKRFGPELEALMDGAALRPSRPLVLCSLRDILVNQRRDQARHDERAAVAVNRWFDGVLVHSDPAFATLDESFRPATPLAVPVHHTGFVAPAAPSPGPVEPRVLVSAGGGMVGGPLALAAAAAAGEVHARTGLRTTVVAGPFLPADDLARLRALEGSPHLEVVGRLDDLCGHIARSAVSLSQCGYNTAMDLLRAGRPAVVVPYSEGREDEQRRRAERLARLGVLRVLDPAALTPEAVAAAVASAAAATPRPHGLDLDGAARTAAIVASLATAGVAA
ncbi:MAG: glycosyltransferase [Thermoleophilia bacterium]